MYKYEAIIQVHFPFSSRHLPGPTPLLLFILKLKWEFLCEAHKVNWICQMLIIFKQERKTFIRSEAITMLCMIVIPESHSSRDETDYVIS